MEGRAKMDDSRERRSSVSGRTGDHRATDPVRITGSNSAAYLSYAYGRTGHDIRMGAGYRPPRTSARLPTWYHWAIIAVALAGLAIVAVVGAVYGG